MMDIAPIMLACGERYTKLATISIESYLRFHKDRLIVVTDEQGAKVLSPFKCPSLRLTRMEEYVEEAISQGGFIGESRYMFEYDADGIHDRTYSGLKPLIMEEAVKKVSPDATHTLSLDSDTLFTGYILDKVRTIIDGTNNVPDFYLVDRKHPKMLHTGSKEPGSGFTLWKRKGRFIPTFRKKCHIDQIGAKGGSQNTINMISGKIHFRSIRDPLLHFVSPDLKNPDITDQEILELNLKPAYIHLHGADSYSRLLRFRRVILGY